MRAKGLGPEKKEHDFFSLALSSQPLAPVLTASQAVAAVVAEVAVAVADGDRTAVVAGGSVGLEFGELLAAKSRSVAGEIVAFVQGDQRPRTGPVAGGGRVGDALHDRRGHG